MMVAHFDPVVLRLISILKRALPDYSDEDIFWGYHFVTGALMNTLARTGKSIACQVAFATPTIFPRCASALPNSWQLDS